MDASARILVYSAPGAEDLLDDSILTTARYDIARIAHPQEIESWHNTFLEEALVILVLPSAAEGIDACVNLLQDHPYIPIILITPNCTLPDLKRALEIGVVDYLTVPVDPSTMLISLQRGLARQKRWQEWNRLTRVFNEHRDGIILADLDGRLSMVNHVARSLFCMAGEQPEGKMVSEALLNPDLIALFNSSNPFPHHGEISIEDGRVYGAQASLIPGIGVVAVLQEITHLKEMDRIKTDFVNTVSHDLRSPLTAIYGFLGLIDKVGTVNEQQAEFIAHIQTSVQHITSLINDLLELGRVEADYDIQMEEVNLAEIVTQSVNQLDFQVNEKMQELVLSMGENLPGILGNPLHMQRMVINLVENAVKFTPPLGKIQVRCRAEANQVVLEVADNGPGIPLDDQPHVFEKFYRGSNLSQSTPGTGLGLSIVKSIVEKHRGRIWLESSPQGTTFTVILPSK
ncbi:MAG: hypothetical protein A2136_11485 [Chloroflexi bacterium RBG_16_54_11]|nr:MAG: hypothetical protein A2136_11485 [Chloroflexi bacterium RBG_16_54_11]